MGGKRYKNCLIVLNGHTLLIWADDSPHSLLQIYTLYLVFPEIPSGKHVPNFWWPVSVLLCYLNEHQTPNYQIVSETLYPLGNRTQFYYVTVIFTCNSDVKYIFSDVPFSIVPKACARAFTAACGILKMALSAKHSDWELPGKLLSI